MNNRKNIPYTLAALGAVLLLCGQSPALAAPLVTGTPVQTIYTKFGNPAIDPATNPDWFNNEPVNYDSPDGSDIVYLGTNPSTTPTPGVTYRNTLLVCDGEVDEMALALWTSPAGTFSGFNLFEMDLIGAALNKFSTTNSTRTGWSNEPVGCSFNPNNGHLFVSDDDQRLVFEINPGTDNQLFTGDDIRTSFSTSAFGDNDPEGLAYNPVDGALYLVNGSDSEIHKLTPGANGRFDGVPPAGDDVATHFDTFSQGVADPEGIAFDADNRLYVVGKPQTRMAHIYTTGPLVRTVDISAFNAGAGPRKPAGLAVGPTGTVFISARGMDNNADPNENDGTVHEVSVPSLGTPPPAVAAGPDLTVFIPNSAQLNGAAVNAGTTTWSQISGPGIATFGNLNAAVTTASFPTDGIYVLRLSDNGSSAYDDVTVQARQPSAGFGTIYVSPLLSTKVPVNPDDPNSLKLSVANEDIIAYDTASRTWSVVFDGSKVGLGATGVNVDAFKVMADGSILLSLDVPVTLPITDATLGTVVSTPIDDSDIVRFVPTSLGANTAGSFQWFFDGSDVGLDTDSEDIDSIGFLPSGKLVVSLTGSGSVPGVSTAQDEDLIAFTDSDLGTDTVGTWTMHFDGSDVELADGGDGEDVLGAWIDSNNAESSDIYLSTKGAFSVTGAVGDGADILKCTPSSIGTTTACGYAFNWDGGGNGIAVGVVLDGIDLVPSLSGSDTTPPTVSITAPADSATVSGTITSSADASDDVGVVGVQFKLDGTNLGAEDASFPYSTSWNTTSAVNGSTHSLTAVARDAAGHTTASSTVSVTVNNAASDVTPPTVNMTAPANGATVSGSIAVSADASDDVGVVGVQFKLDGNNLDVEDTSSPYSTSWNTTSAANGSTHSLTAVARDAAGHTTSSTVSVTVNNASSGSSIDVRVSNSSDDAEEVVATGATDFSSSDLEVTLDAANQIVGLRFNAVAIPQGASITNAYIQFQADEASSTTPTLQIWGQADDNPATFTTTAFNISSRPKTTAPVSWSPAAWPTIDVAGTAQMTPNIATVIQQIVSRPGWTSGNALVVMITGDGNGKRTAEAFNGVPAAAALLHVDYANSGSGNTAPSVTVSAPANNSQFAQGAQITFSGTATDTQDGNKTASISWTSSINGALGTGGSISTSSLSAGTHTITAAVTDSGNLTGSASITVTISAGNTAPSVTISAPANNSQFAQGTQITFSGTATDTQDGNKTASISWTSSINGALGTGGSISTSSLSAGTHTITAAVTDSGNLTGSASISVTVNGSGGGGSIEVRVSNSSDDAEEVVATGATDFSSSDLEVTFDAANQIVGLRFNAVAIPQGASITNAYIQFQADEASSTTTTLQIWGQAADNPPTFTTTAFNISLRPRVTDPGTTNPLAISWSPAAWPTIDVAGIAQMTPNIAMVIQQIVSRPGWTSGNALVVMITGDGNGKRTAEAFNGVPAAAALLHVEYTN